MVTDEMTFVQDLKYPPVTTAHQIEDVLKEICDLLLRKNEAYGDSALHPVRIFSRAANDEQLRIRIDDKLSRLARGNESIENDDEILNDIIGYLVLLKVARKYG